MGIRKWVGDKAKTAAQTHIVNNYNGWKQQNQTVKNSPDPFERENARKQRWQHTKGLATAGATVGTLGGLYAAKKVFGRAKDWHQNSYRPRSSYTTKKGTSLFGTIDIFLLFVIWYYLTAPAIWGNGQLRLTVNFLIGFLMYFMVLEPGERTRNAIITLFVIALIDLLWVQLLYLIPGIMKTKMGFYYFGNIQVIVPWFYYIVIQANGRTLLTKLGKFLMILQIFATFLSIPMVAAFAQDISVDQAQVGAAGTYWKNLGTWSKGIIFNFKEVMDQGQAYFVNQLRYATGDAYTGAVDENQQETLGVFLKDLKASDPQFYAGDTVTVWALLKAKTLEDGLRLNVNCYYGNKAKDGTFTEGQKGEVYPDKDKMPIIFDEEEIDIDCRFPYSKGMDDGTNKVTVQTDFNFETMAYLKTYFMDGDRMRSMERQGIDPLDQYGIEDKKPIARYTNGPVMIGMASAESPIGISDNSISPRLGVTLSTNTGWKGKIKQIKELIIMVPDTMSLDTDFCTEFVKVEDSDYQKDCIDQYERFRSKQLIECVEKSGLDSETDIGTTGKVLVQAKQGEVTSCMQKFCNQEIENYKVYRLKVDGKTESLYSNIGYDALERKYKTFSCRVKLDKPQKILGNTPLSVQYFRVKARYEYGVEADTNVVIKRIKPETSTNPEPTKEGVTNVPYVHNYWSDLINKNCNRVIAGRKLFEDTNECYCFMLGMINIESNGRDKVLSKKGAEGLMQVMPSTASRIRDKYKLEAGELYDADYNAMIATYYLHELKFESTAYTKGKLDYLMAAYNGGTCGWNADKKSFQGALCDSKTCPGKTFYECEENDRYKETRDYVVKVKASMAACQELQLPTLGQKTDEVNKDAFLSTEQTHPLTIDEDIDSGKFVIRIHDNSVRGPSIDGNPGAITKRVYDVTLGFKSTDTSYRIDRNTIENVVDDQWYFFRLYPFVRFKFMGGNLISQTWQKTVINSPRLISGEVTPKPGGGQEAKLTPIWTIGTKDYLYAHYTGSSINLYDENKKPFCTVPWSKDAVYSYCENENTIGIKVNRILTETQTTDSQKPYVIAQFVYDPEIQHTCCNNCQDCSPIYCEICSNCIHTPSSTLDWLHFDYSGLLCYKKPQS